MKDPNYIRICLYCKVKKCIFLLQTSFIFIFSSTIFAGTFSIATQNAYNFYNDKHDGKNEKVLSTKNYQKRLRRMSSHIVNTLNSPDVIALQEVENFSTLDDLKQILKDNYQQCYQVVLLEGHKKVSINLGYLVACNLQIKNLSQLFKNTQFNRSNRQLFTRPPLYLNVCKQSSCFHLVNVHLRSMIGLNNKRKSRYVAKKRLQQAEAMARWINDYQTQWPKEKLIILGDFNALSVSDRIVDVLGIIKGSASLNNDAYTAKDLVSRNLFDLSLQIPSERRFSYRYKNKQQTLDYILVSQNLVPSNQSIKITPINYKISDHAGIIAQFK